MSSPWAKIQPIEPTNLQDIMSEQVAIDLQAKKDRKCAESIQQDNSSVENAEMCAANVEIPPESVCDSDEEEDELIDVMDLKDWDRYDTVVRTISLIPRCGNVKQDGNMLTKHDKTFCGRKNLRKFKFFPSEIQTGDLQLSNKVSSKEQVRRHKLHDRKMDHATAEVEIDDFTRLLLYKLINKQILKRVNGVISTGKEAVIFHADRVSSPGRFSGSEGRSSFSEGENSTSEDFTALSPNFVDVRSSEGYSASRGISSSAGVESAREGSLGYVDEKVRFSDGFRSSSDSSAAVGCFKSSEGVAASSGGVAPSEDISSRKEDSGPGKDIRPFEGKSSKGLLSSEGVGPLSENVILPSEDTSPSSLGDLNTPSKGNLNESIQSGSTTTSSPSSKGFRPSLGTSPPSNPNPPPSSATYSEDSSYPSNTGSLNFPTIVPKECVVKIFKTTLSDFMHRDKYIKDDYRFKDRYSRQNTRKMIQLWAEKETCNLIRLRKIGLPCPEVIALKKHILVLSFIGKYNKPAPKLKDAHLKPSEWIVAYEQVVEAMKKLYSEAKLIHADLSEYNILWHENKCWFIDVSQSVERKHPKAFRFLIRDCVNIYRFFWKKVPDVKLPRDLFMDVTGYDYGFLTLALQQEMHNPSQFDYDWELLEFHKRKL